MSKFLSEEFDEIVNSLSKVAAQKEKPTHGPISKLAYAELKGSPPTKKPSVERIEKLKSLKTKCEVRFGHKSLTLLELAALQAGDLLILNENESAPVKLYIDERVIGEGVLVAIDGKFGLKITSL